MGLFGFTVHPTTGFFKSLPGNQLIFGMQPYLTEKDEICIDDFFKLGCRKKKLQMTILPEIKQFGPPTPNNKKK